METDDLSRSISGGEYDFCFMPRDMVPESSDIETLSTHTDSLVIVSASRRRNKKLTLSDVSQEKLLLLSEAGAPILYMEVIDLLRSFHVSPKAEIGFDDVQSLLVATASGIGVTILPKSFAEFTSDKRLTTHPVEDADTGLAYVMAWARNTQNPAAGLFIETARKLASGEDNVYGI
jgi:DNA-binding transcriptional LysR family regulator